MVPEVNQISDCVFNSWVVPEALLLTKKLVFGKRICFNSESSFLVLNKRENQPLLSGCLCHRAIAG